jgi:hypothetical protein
MNPRGPPRGDTSSRPSLLDVEITKNVDREMNSMLTESSEGLILFRTSALGSRYRLRSWSSDNRMGSSESDTIGR